MKVRRAVFVDGIAKRSSCRGESFALILSTPHLTRANHGSEKHFKRCDCTLSDSVIGPVRGRPRFAMSCRSVLKLKLACSDG